MESKKTEPPLEALEKKKIYVKGSKPGNLSKNEKRDPERDFKSKTAFVVYSPRTGVYFCIKMAFF